MNIKQLETFYWIERLGSFSAAAERVFATQSTVSMRIQELEQSLGVKLFDRSHRTARLTPKGKELVPYVQQLIELTAEMQRRITPPESMSGLVRVGVVEIIASTWLPRFIRTLQETYPNILLELEVALSFELTEKLRNGSLDVVFALGRPPGTNYVIESLGSVQLEWMASPALGIPEDTVAPRDLQPWPFITLNRQSYHHARIQTWMKENKVRCRRIIVCNSMTVAATLVMAGIGVSLLPPRCYHREIEARALRIVRTTGGMAPVEFFAMYPLDEFQPLAQLVTGLAARVSDFDRAGQESDGGTAAPQSPSPPASLGKKRSRKTPILGGSPS
ncbi:LysR family transcriptional regulator [Pelomicrobium sp.]|jgi:DNA-binding transcriptional LysR family regulator|uniref:LysR family transcriptional regulator n=1 Tax=Pelomicrobium sp. TaxID=2815319 RepID=UPI002FDDE150